MRHMHVCIIKLMKMRCAIMLLLALVCSCQLTQERNSTEAQSVVVLLAHPDDETWVSGTLAKLADRGVRVFPVYATSGDAGRDHSGQGLSGAELARVREQEAIAASSILGLEAPIFLRFPDGKLTHNKAEVVTKIKTVIEGVKPFAVFSFVSGGITGNRDHKTVSAIVEEHFYRNAVYFGVSHSRSESLTISAHQFGLNYRVAVPIDDTKVSVRVDISCFKEQRIWAMESHKTQFLPIMVKAYEYYSELVLIEEIYIRNSYLGGNLIYRFLE